MGEKDTTRANETRAGTQRRISKNQAVFYRQQHVLTLRINIYYIVI